MLKEMKWKDFVMTVLNGVALGTVIALISGALLGELMKALVPQFPSLATVSMALTMSNGLIGLISGFLIGVFFKFTSIQSAALGLATQFGGGAIVMKDKALTISGTGDIINIGLTAALGAWVIILLGDKLKAYSIIAIPPILLVGVGSVGLFMLQYVRKITTLIGEGVGQLLGLQPILMGIILAIIFSILIVSPITSVGIALAISLSGVGSGAANLGICVCGFGFAILGWTVNSRGTSLAHFIGSPKLSMPNVIKKPLIMLPIICGAAIAGAVAVLFNIQGTPMSAGFGFSGLVGPINHLNAAGVGMTLPNILITVLVFVVIPVTLNLIFKYIFFKLVPILKADDYKLDM